MSEPDFPGQRFKINATSVVGASPEAQVKYLQVLLRLKDDKLKTLELQLETQKLETALDRKQVEKRIEMLSEINSELRRSKPARMPQEVLDWIEWKSLPWWKRIFRRKK